MPGKYGLQVRARTEEDGCRRFLCIMLHSISMPRRVTTLGCSCREFNNPYGWIPLAGFNHTLPKACTNEDGSKNLGFHAHSISSSVQAPVHDHLFRHLLTGDADRWMSWSQTCSLFQRQTTSQSQTMSLQHGCRHSWIRARTYEK